MIIRALLRNHPIPTTFRRPFQPCQATRIVGRALMSTGTSPPKLENVIIETEPGIAIIRYNRPKNSNALNTPILKDALTAFRWADQNEDTRIVITTGAGKFYTAGLDLLDPINEGPESTISDEFIDVLGDIHETLINSNKVLISAVNGPAPGWGTSSLALTDLVYSTPDAIFFTPFVQWGLCAEGCSSTTFKAILGRQKASALILAGQRMTPAELESAGLITKIFPKETFFEDVMSVAKGIAKLPPATLKVNKELMMRGTREELLKTNEVEMEVLRKQARSSESKNAISGFREATEKRKREKASKL